MNYSWKDIDEKKTRKWIVLERREDLWDTIAWCAENHRMVWLKYETVEDNEIISRKVAPYSYRTRRTKVRGKSTYFYAQDFTPGQDHEIKCFLIDNCLQAKKSMQKFSPKFPIEIKQEIDRLEQKRQQDELEKKNREKKDIKKNHPIKKKDNIVSPKDKDVDVPVKKPTAKKPMVKPEKPVDSKEPVKPVEKPKKDISKDDVRVSKPEQEKPEKTSVKEKPKPQKQKDNDEDEIVVTDKPEDNVSKKPDTDEIQVTDDDGNVVKESNWIQLH